jgi:hypothetical protein
MLLKQRGHELNLPPPRIMGDNPARSLSPQDLTDRRVNRASAQHHILDDFEGMAQMSPRIANISDARRHLEDNQFNQQALANALEDAERNQAEEGHFERLQGDLDRQTLARMGQQHEADEMEAMGVPPMSRTLGGTPPANLGRAGSTGENENIEPSNPFPKPIGQNVRGDLMNWAAGAGREAGKPDIVDRTYDEGGSQFDLSQMYDDAEESEYEDEPLHENNPAKHSIASTTLRASPRQQKRGQMDSGRNEFRRPGDESSKRMNPSQRLLQQMMQMNARKEAGF